MKKQDKELLIKELCARLPYKVKVQIKANNCYDGINVLNFDDLNSFIENKPRDEDWYDVVTSIKPYLRPMSSMTEEERKIQHEKEYDGYIGDDVDYLNSIHVDYRGLIEQDLALPAPEDMYK